MKRILITFGGSAYDSVTEKTVRLALGFGVDEVWVYDDLWLTEQPLFQTPEFQYLFTHRGVGNPNGKRGFGWFCWKPYIIRHALDTFAADGDIVMFLDGDTYPVASFGMLYEECSRIGGIMAFMATARYGPLRNGAYNKRDCMIQMGMDEQQYLDAGTAVARFMLFQKGIQKVDEFLAIWQAFCLDPLCQTFEPSRLAPEHPGFKEHRTEQAIYTNLCHRYGLKLYREACEFGNDCQQDWELYGQLFKQEWTNGRKSLNGSRFRNV